MNSKSKKLIRKSEVIDISGIGSHSSLYYLMKHGDFPLPVRLGKRTVAWRESEVFEWIDSRERSMNVQDETSVTGAAGIKDRR